ncbi:MAG: hypothetical protein A2913_00770 [Parcubacteria group bacterium RIFCSPLOWO2_01_FULL_40_65]|nr:MAG: hypothetical protein A2734_02490 [Parcubacteria group bacterium RIFCSPHIGHO2_01_FULL_40_30]OHB19416.1 MAG: hypothetical protein A3D40_00610 [Parcubacteria group bacterium RIFCSPHIGHO2_02_FULL_40_12]OHB21113.1 MAG: hypothetical protein A2913_00770 [Parcubacteria group bacterium RIFCSPLOWO2_01_FULL_40_65]OHB23443.1 MAG: hypothetical protein A3I22_01425 [Parcubacteria group bacterium RIFCSPLOWO2_02_FULL_40_12]OHB23908.1 MAG: hypothetical protein A3F96_01640 [Parcubacteria group bacterium R
MGVVMIISFVILPEATIFAVVVFIPLILATMAVKPELKELYLWILEIKRSEIKYRQQLVPVVRSRFILKQVMFM